MTEFSLDPIDNSPEAEEALVFDFNYDNRRGYDENFLEVAVPLPLLSDQQIAEVAKIKGSEEYELRYEHFTLVHSAPRRIPFFTAVNIDSEKYEAMKDEIPSRKQIGKDKWILDRRIDESVQVKHGLYKNSDFDFGHLVRRQDPVWGETLEEALRANSDSFHLTNATPQHHDFNTSQHLWLGLEDYALKNARQNRLAISVFTGPVLNENDPHFEAGGEEIQVPLLFWKVIVMIKEDGKPSATGYIVSQKHQIKDLLEKESFTFGAFKTFQVPIAKIEELTGMRFDLSSYDPMNGEEFEEALGGRPVVLESEADIKW